MSPIKRKSPSKKKYTRKKRVIQHPNPLFDKWLLEWERGAADIGSNMKYNYRRARNNLKLYPLPVYKGSDCKVIHHFGDKICQMLDRRLQKHIDENGPIVWEEIHKVIQSPAVKRRGRKKTVSAKRPVAVLDQEPVAHSSTSDPDTPSSRKRGGRPYVPAFRSGAYALLVALYSHIGKDTGFMKKAELIEAAQPHSNASFSQAPDGSHYTAWSSMSILIKKNLVTRQSCPAKYSLTAEGKELAMKLVSAGHPGSMGSLSVSSQEVENPDIVTLSSRSCSPVSLSSLPSKNAVVPETYASIDLPPVDEVMDISSPKKSRTLSNLNGKGHRISKSQNAESSAFDCSDKGSNGLTLLHSSKRKAGDLIFSYVSSLEMETPLKDKALVSVEDDGFLGYLIKCRLTALINSGLSYRTDDSRIAPLGFVYAYLSHECAPTHSPGLLSPSLKDPPTSRIFAASGKKSPNAKPAKISRNSLKSVVSGSNYKPSDTTSLTIPSKGPNLNLGVAKAPVSLLDAIPQGQGPQMPRTVDSVSSSKRLCMEGDISSQPLFSLLPGQYEIILCVDNCETKGGHTGVTKLNTREIIISELDKHKIRYDVRKLHVGDFLWIIRERSTYQPRELVLPYIVERKRMDDLASSIRDGRFKEQKFRLKQFNFSKPIYLVEEYGTQNLSIPESTCLQAVTNTQIVDGFTVKITKDQQESAAFLTIMTRCLQSKYQGKTVRSFTVDDLQSQDLSDSTAVHTALVTFADFNSSSMKNRQLPVKEMFAKQLLQLHGLSVEKAKALVEKYGTPAALISAYENLENPSDSENMLMSLKCGKTARNFGPALSLNIARLYTSLILN